MNKLLIGVNMYKGFFVFILLSIVAVNSYSYSSLEVSDLTGRWVSQYKHSNSYIEFREGVSGVFVQNVGADNETTLLFEDQFVFFHDDILIIEFYAPDTDYLFARLVLSGWDGGSIKMLYGMRFLYEGKGRQFNGIPQSFKAEAH